RPRVTGPSSFTARPTASPTVITSASGTWRWPPSSSRSRPKSLRRSRTTAPSSPPTHRGSRPRSARPRRGAAPMVSSAGAGTVAAVCAATGGGVIEPEFVRRLEAAPSNVRDYGDGGEVYRRLIQPAVVDWRRVIAHNAITGLLAEQPDEGRVYAWRIDRVEETREAYYGTAMRIGHVRTTS